VRSMISGVAGRMIALVLVVMLVLEMMVLALFVPMLDSCGSCMWMGELEAERGASVLWVVVAGLVRKGREGIIRGERHIRMNERGYTKL